MNLSYFPNLHYWLPLLKNLGTVKLSCLKHCQRLFADIFIFCWHYFFLSSWLLLLFFFSFFALFLWLIAVICFADFILTKHFCKSSNTCGSSTHFANIWHADKTEVVNVPFEKKHLLNDVFNLLYLKLWSENIFKTRLVSSEKYKPSFLS